MAARMAPTQARYSGSDSPGWSAGTLTKARSRAPAHAAGADASRAAPSSSGTAAERPVPKETLSAQPEVLSIQTRRRSQKPLSASS